MKWNYTISNLPFYQVELQQIVPYLTNLFKEKNNKTVAETLISPKYQMFSKPINQNYFNHLKEPLGQFLYFLKSSGDNFYLKFLNPYGDLVYSKFRLRKNIEQKGLYYYALGGDIVYIGRCLDSFTIRISIGYGNISPKNCYIDGQSVNCRINSLVTQNWHKMNLFICPLIDDSEIIAKETKLIIQYNPEWNFASKGKMT